jgi:hypothetical protein
MVADVDAFGVEPIAEFLSETLRRMDEAPRREPSVMNLSVDNVLMDVVLKELAEPDTEVDNDD